MHTSKTVHEASQSARWRAEPANLLQGAHLGQLLQHLPQQARAGLQALQPALQPRALPLQLVQVGPQPQHLGLPAPGSVTLLRRPSQCAAAPGLGVLGRTDGEEATTLPLDLEDCGARGFHPAPSIRVLSSGWRTDGARAKLSQNLIWVPHSYPRFKKHSNASGGACVFPITLFYIHKPTLTIYVTCLARMGL